MVGGAGSREAGERQGAGERTPHGRGVKLTEDLLGAHVSVQGGMHTAPERGMAIGANAIQVFTKTPSQWRDPDLASLDGEQFRRELKRAGLRAVVAHDSYLINLASPDPRLRTRSVKSFIAELKRCTILGIPAVVSHPGNYMNERDSGLSRNAEAYARCLDAVPGPVMVLLETTAGTGTALGSRFEELAELRRRIPAPHRERIGFCADTCHIYSAGYDLVNDYDGVWRQWDQTIGIDLLRCLHLNDSKTPFASRRDRHELIAEGSLGAGPFRRIMTDDRFRHVVKVIETPKGDDLVTSDRRMLRRLRSYARRAKRSVGVLALLTLGVALPGFAQARYSVSLGAAWASPLVTDHIGNTIQVQQSIAPALTLGASWRVSSKLRAGPDLTLETGGYSAQESGGSADLGTLRSLTLKGGLEGRAKGAVWWRGDLGVVKYLPSEDAGIFADGGGHAWLLGIGADYRRPRSGGRSEWFAGLRYDIQRFTTDALESQGFKGSQVVHRVFLSLGFALIR